MTQYLNFALKHTRKEQKEQKERDEVWMANLDDGMWMFTLLFSIYAWNFYNDNNDNRSQ